MCGLGARDTGGLAGELVAVGMERRGKFSLGALSTLQHF